MLSGMANTQCTRCHRGAPPQDSDDFLHWEALGPDGLAVVCPSCITGEEQQAMDEDMMDLAEKVRENRLRRAAGRQGLRLSKSRRRDPRAIDYGGYMIVDTSTNAVVAGASPIAYNMNLDEVEDFLLGETA